jgi:hypothetical protein
MYTPTRQNGTRRNGSSSAQTLTSTALTTLVAMMLAPMAFGAATTGTIQGKVTSPSGAPVANATVTLESSGQTTRTDSGGNYTFTGVEPAPQTIRVRAGTAYQPTETTVTVSQDITSTANVQLRTRTVNIQGIRVQLGTGGVRRVDPSTTYGISTVVEQQTKSQPNNLYQFPGLVFGQPGITPDPSGYVHIRGSDFNQVGFDVDGVQITEPMTNSFAINIVTVGLKSANLYTGGADASYGNATGGFINEVTNNGRDLRGGIVEGTFGPSHGWNYRGTNSQYGNILAGNKFDYYVSTIQFANSFPGNTQIQKLGASFDGVAKFNYYADPNNTFTGFLSQGFEQYDTYDPNNSAHAFKYEVGPNSSVNKGSFQQDHDDQGYNFNYLGYKHNFDAKSFATYKLYQLKNFFNDHVENTSGAFQNRHATTTGNQLDYTNQLSPLNQLKVGFSYIPSSTYFRSIAQVGSAQLQPFSTLPARGYADIISQAKPDQTVLYLSDNIRAAGDKATLTLGGRYASMNYRLNDLPNQVVSGNGLGTLVDARSFTTHYFDPRVGATYSPVRDFVLRSSYAVESQFSDSRLVERLFPEDNNVNIAPTAKSGPAQLKYLQGRYAQYNKLGPNHANNFDLGFDKGFNLSGLGAFNGGYTFSATGFDRKQYDLIQLTRLGYSPLKGVRGYDNSGHGHASGAEFKLGKSASARDPYAVNGFVSYTNQVAKATSSDFDTGYASYFYTAFAGDTLTTEGQFRSQNGQEYATTYDQRHTIGVDLTKRFNKLFETSIILDAGSGFPFNNALANVGESSDAQHSQQTFGNNASFGEVPVTLFDKHTLQPFNPTVGQSGWHYKISLNSNFYLTPTTSVFFDVDNVFDKKTVLNYSTVNQAGTPYYDAPSAAYPQGRIYYGPSTIITPVFATFGFRTKF